MLRVLGGFALLLLTAAVVAYAFAPRTAATPPPLFGPTIIAVGHAAQPSPVDDSLVLGLDTFTRPAAGAWSATDRGGPYTLLGPAADFGIAPGVGTIRNPVPGAVRGASLLNVQARDVDMRVRLEADRPTAGGDEFVYLLLRRIDNQDFYVGRVRFDAYHTAWLQAGRTVGGVTTLLGTETAVPGYVQATGLRLWVRAEAMGAGPTTLRLKGWPSAEDEPQAWSCVTEDAEPSLQVPGAVTIQTYLSDQIENAPVTFGFSDLRVWTSPATATPTATLAPATPVPTSPPTLVPSPTPTASDVWQSMAPALDAVWGSDTQASISLVQHFLTRFPDFQPAREKLYAGLIARAGELTADDQPADATALLEQAQELLPERDEAQAALLALTPTPTPPPPVSVNQVAPSAPVRVPTPRPPTPLPVVRPAPPPPTPTKVPFVPPSSP